MYGFLDFPRRASHSKIILQNVAVNFQTEFEVWRYVITGKQNIKIIVVIISLETIES